MLTVQVPMLRELPAGSFQMGDDQGHVDERPRHLVSVGPFCLGRFPVTNNEYHRYIEATRVPEPRFWRDQRFNQAQQPVVGVSWFEAMDYCRWLSNVTGGIYRFPTEAEREWAALGGIEGTRYPCGNEEPVLEGLWAPGDAGQDRPVAVSDAQPNGYGLCHMADNVHEWCSDWWDPAYYAVSPVDDPQGPATGTRRASRGGAWRHYLKFSRCAARSSLDPTFRYNDYGFRVAANNR